MCLGFEILGLGFQVLALGFKILVVGFQISDLKNEFWNRFSKCSNQAFWKAGGNIFDPTVTKWFWRFACGARLVNFFRFSANEVWASTFKVWLGWGLDFLFTSKWCNQKLFGSGLWTFGSGRPDFGFGLPRFGFGPWGFISKNYFLKLVFKMLKSSILKSGGEHFCRDRD